MDVEKIIRFEKTIRDAIDTFGEENQIIVAIEEFSELQKELCKRLRGNDNLDRIAEEIADAQIMIEQLYEMFGINDAVVSFTDYKMLRLEARIKAKRGERD